MADVYRFTGAAVLQSTTAEVWRYSGAAVIAQYILGVSKAQIDVIETPTVSGLSVYKAQIDVIEGPGVVAPPAPDLRLPVQIIAY